MRIQIPPHFARVTGGLGSGRARAVADGPDAPAVIRDAPAGPGGRRAGKAIHYGERAVSPRGDAGGGVPAGEGGNRPRPATDVS